MPVGFESTGVTMLVAIMNVANLGSGLLASVILEVYNVGDGYYERAYTPFKIVCWISLGVNVICPLFVAWRVKGLKKSSEKIENMAESVKQDPAGESYKTMKDIHDEQEYPPQTK